MSAKKLRALDPLLHEETDRLNDLLHKKSDFVERFYQLVHNTVEPPFAISIDGLWGTGKTTVMKMLEDKFMDRGYPVFWFNPWKYSQSSDVVLAFLQGLTKKSRSLFQEIDSSKGKLFNVLLRVGLGAALKITTQGTISMDDVTKAFKEEDLPFENYEDMIIAIEKEFKDLVNTISIDKYQKNPLIIFLDDFDRCLPQDSIKLLEALKNLFVTKDCRVIFICGIDTRVAKNFIRDHYKVSDEFAINYFRKIFNLTVSMPYHQDNSIYALLQKHIKTVYGWNDEKAGILAEIVSLRGIQAEMTSVRKYLNVIHNFYVFLSFNPDYQFTSKNDLVVHLLIVKEAWQPLYETLIGNALKNRADSLSELVGELVPDDGDWEETSLAPEYKFLQTYFISDDYPFHQVKLGSDLLLRYPTLA